MGRTSLGGIIARDPRKAASRCPSPKVMRALYAYRPDLRPPPVQEAA
jgi:hypothetical protein